MAKLGSPSSTKFSIGTAEVRVGPLTSAGRLTQANSIGLVDSASVTITQDSVDLVGGYPQQIVDTAIVKQTSNITATLREYSRRNMRIMLGEGLDTGAVPTDVSSLVTADLVASGTAVSVSTGTGINFTVGDIVVIYPDGQPENVSIDKITAITTDTLTLENGVAVASTGSTSTVHIFVANQIAVGGITKTNYFSVMLIQQANSSGRPLAFTFWKAAMSGSMTYDTNATSFSSNQVDFKLLQPAASEYVTGQPLAHMASTIPTHPTGMYVGGAD